MSDTIELVKQLKSKPKSWVEMARAEITELEEAAKNPKTFYGNHVLGMGDGLARVKELLPAIKNIEQALSALNRVL